MPKALIVEDSEDSRETLVEIVEGENFDAVEAESLERGREALEEDSFDIVFLDLNLPDGSGMELVPEHVGEQGPEFVLVTGEASLSSAVEALRAGVADYLVKPVDVDRLRSILRRAAKASRLRGKVRDLRGELRAMGMVGRMVGRSEAMDRVFERVSKVAPTDATVLIVGESGTGKEILARTITEMSPRSEGSFVPVNCGAIAATIMESELFGHEKGAFTGAESRHRGYFEQADGGTLFLDEITEMGSDLQVKLLRVLETGSFTRVGGEEPIEVDCRLLAATNRNPEKAVREGLLREDLYYRLRVVRIELPPLREREGDVRLLAEHFMHRLNAESGEDKRLDPEVMSLLESYDWPGNVRELQNALRSGYILCDDILDAGCLPEEVVAGAESGRGEDEGELDGEPTIPVRLGGTIAEAEKRLILATLDMCEGNRTKAAEILGVSVKTLYNRLKSYEQEEEGAEQRERQAAS